MWVCKLGHESDFIGDILTSKTDVVLRKISICVEIRICLAIGRRGTYVEETNLKVQYEGRGVNY